MIECEIECTSIPDGFVDVGLTRVNLSLLLKPSYPSTNASVSIDAARWPTAIPELKFQIWAGLSKDDMTQVDIVPAKDAFEGSETSAINTVAEAWWSGLWPKGDDDLRPYLELLNGAGSGDKVERENIGSYEYSELHQDAIHESLHEFRRAYASFLVNRMAADPLSPLDLQAEFKGLALRAARDPNDPIVRVARELKIAQSGATAKVRQATILGPGQGLQLNAPAPDVATILGSNPSLNDDVAMALDPENLDALFAPAALKAFNAQKKGENNDAFEKAMMTNEELGAKDTELDPKYDNAHRVIGTLRSHPALRKFARQIADIGIDVSRLQKACRTDKGSFKGVTAVVMIGAADAPFDAPPAHALFTAFELRLDPDPMFEPCPKWIFEANAEKEEEKAKQNNAVGSSLPIQDGFVYSQVVDGKRRFQIASIDGIAAYFARTRGSQATLGAYYGGTEPKDIPTEPVGFRTRGLMMLDTQAQETARAAEERLDVVKKERLFFAEDLVDGFRIDVVAPNDSAFPACARHVEYPYLTAKLTPQQRRFYSTERNDGSISPLARTWTDSKATHLSVSQVLFTWTGTNFGLANPFLPEDIEEMPAHDFLDDLLDIEYSFDPNRLGAILRFLGHYRFIMAVRKLNGSSRRLPSNLVGAFALGSEQDKAPQLAMKAKDKGYQFAFVEKAPAPTVLVDGGFRPEHAPDAADRETATTILVRTGLSEPKVRWLVSPITGFDLGELQGQFDPKSPVAGDRHKAERRAKTGAYLYLRHQKDGSFPPLFDGKMLLGQVFAPREPVFDPATKNPHYVDATLRTVSARLVASKATAPDLIDSKPLGLEPAFFPLVKTIRDFEPDDVVPVRVEVRAAGSSRKSRIFNGPQFKLKLPGKAGRTLLVPTICVEVAAGDTLELELWTNRTAEAVRANPTIASLENANVGEAFSGILGFFDGGGNGDQLIYDMVHSQRFASLSDVTKLRIEHPVNRPLSQPAAVAPLQIYRAKDLNAWKDLTVDGNGADQEDASKVFVTGKIAFDRKSTGQIWAEAFWQEAEGKIVRTGATEDPDRIEQADLYSLRKPVLVRRLFTLSSLKLPLRLHDESSEDYLQRINGMDLLLEDPDPMKDDRVTRNVMADFDCDQHRVFAVRVVARSRFAPADALAAAGEGALPQGEEDSLEDDGFTQATATRAACRAAVKSEDRDASTAPTVWPSDVYRIEVPATRRPQPPYPTRDEGTAYHRGVKVDGGDATLSYINRIWFDGNWGDETFAIVCRRPRSPALPAWADTQVSRWGGDMASIPGQRLRVATDLPAADATYLMANQIVMADEKEALLWHGGDDQVAEVSLACLKPAFHKGFGRFYCDVELKSTGAFKAGLKLLVARYQEKALPGRQLSSTVPLDTVMLPQPWRFSAKRLKSNIVVTVTGPAYQGRAPMLDQLEGISKEATMRLLSNLVGNVNSVDMRSLTQTPLIVAELERLNSDGHGPLPVFNAGRLVVANNLQASPDIVSEPMEGFDHPVQLKQWRLSLTIPEEDLSEPLSVRVSMATAHANSHARRKNQARTGSNGFQPAALEGSLVFLPEPIVIDLPV